MKNFKSFGLLLFISISIMGCSKEDAEFKDFSDLGKQLSGDWIEISPYPDYHSLIFLKESVQFSSQDGTEKIDYVVFSPDSIRCQRILNGVSVTTKHQFMFDKKDNTLLLKNFIAGVEAYPGVYSGDVRHFHNITFQRPLK